MKCNSCNAELKTNAKFCGNCGAKVDAGKDKPHRLLLAPSPLGLAECAIKILEVKGKGPDGDGDIQIDIKYEITNKTDQDWEYLVARIQVLTDQQSIIEETHDTYEQTVSAGESAEFETSLLLVLKTLGENPSHAIVVVGVTACETAFQKLGEFDVPAQALEKILLEPVKLGNVLQLISGTVSKTEPDSDKDSSLEVKALVQNLTPQHLHEVKIIAGVTDKVGREVTDASGSEEVRAGDICVIRGDGGAQEKQFNGAKVALALRAYFPAATGIDQHTGINISAPEVSDESDDEADETANDNR